VKPVALPVKPDSIPAELKQWPQWVVWRYEWKADKRNKKTGELGEWDKPPYNARTGALASSTARSSWSSFEEAMDRYLGGGYDGVGFCPGDGDPFCCGDFDGYIQDGIVDPKVNAVVEAFGSYAEISPSGTGVRLLVKGHLPGGKGRNNREKRAELYDRGHYLTITGHSLNGSMIAERQAQLEQLYAQLERKPAVPDIPLGGDAGLLMRARNAKNGPKFRALFDDGDASDYPSQSNADLALCCLLAFWTRKDPVRMDKLFRQSRLMRDKWDEVHGADTYGRMTIDQAIVDTTQTVSPGADGHEKPTGLSYYARGRQRIWQIHFPFGDVEIANSEITKWAAVEAACTGSEVARLPEYNPSGQEWKTWLREQMPQAEELPEFPELDERGRAVAAILRHVNDHSSDHPGMLLVNGVWYDAAGERYVIAGGILRNNLDNQYKPWLTPVLMNSVLRTEFQGAPLRVWLPSGLTTKQEQDKNRPHVVVIAETVVKDLTG
jgi:putative DNA primase/helicase